MRVFRDIHDKIKRIEFVDDRDGELNCVIEKDNYILDEDDNKFLLNIEFVNTSDCSFETIELIVIQEFIEQILEERK